MTRARLEELRELNRVWERLIQKDANECLDTIDVLLKVAEAAQVHCDYHHDDEAMTLKKALAALKQPGKETTNG